MNISTPYHLQISFLLKELNIEQVEDFLIELGAVAVTLTDAEDEPIFEPKPEEMHLWSHTRIQALFEDNVEPALVKIALQQHFNINLVDWQTENIPQTDWQEKLKQDFHAMRFGKHLWICPSWETVDDPEGTIIQLDPGLAFGTGDHQTTALCLEWLAENPPYKQLIIDYGCGSGILSIAALKLGARHVWAIDHDPQALKATENNALANDILPSHLYPAHPEDLPPLQANLVIANIFTNVLIELASIIENLLEPKGTLLLTGILTSQKGQILRAYSGIEFIEERIKEDWILLIGQKR